MFLEFVYSWYIKNLQEAKKTWQTLNKGVIFCQKKSEKLQTKTTN